MLEKSSGFYKKENSFHAERLRPGGVFVKMSSVILDEAVIKLLLDLLAS
jgi:hypothetical protein